MHKSKLITMFAVLTVLTLLSLNFIMAFEFDNVKSYDVQKQQITVKNSFGLGKDLARIKLDTPIVNYVMAGKDRLVAEMTFESYEAYVNAFNNMKFYNKRNNVQIQREFKYKVKDTQDIKVDDYEKVCSEAGNYKNGSKIMKCDSKIIGSHIEKKTIWTEIDKADGLPKGTLTVGIFTDVLPTDDVEWIPTFYGVEINEWATWTSSLAVGLKWYFNGNDTINKEGNTSVFMTLSGTASNGTVAGKVGKGYAVDLAGNPAYITQAFHQEPQWTMNWWVKSSQGEIQYMRSQSGTNVLYCYYHEGGARGHYCVIAGLTAINTNEPEDTTNYHMITLQQNATSQSLYVNGVLKASAVQTGLIDGPDLSTTGLSGNIDEWSFWNRSLSSTEILDEYNSNVGLTWEDTSSSSAPVVTLNSPVDYFNSTVSSVLLNCSAKRNLPVDAHVSNLTLIINGIVNTTISNSTANQNLTLAQTLSFADGDYNWTCNSSNYDGQVGTATVRHFNIHADAPNLLTQNFSNVSTVILPVNQKWIINATDVGGLFNCYYNTSDNPTSITSVACNTSIYTQWNSSGQKIISYCANDTASHTTCANQDITVFYFYTEQHESIDPASEGTSVVFNLYVNTSNLATIPTTTATFNLNGTQYAPDTITSGTQYYNFTKTIIFPDGYGNSSGNILNWNWNFTVAGYINNSSMTTTNITVYSVSFDECTTNTHSILNFTLRDEETGTVIDNTYLNGTRIELDMIISSLADSSITFHYNNTWINDSNGKVGVCVPDGLLNNSLYRIDFIAEYQTVNHVVEFYYLDNGRLSNNNSFNSLTTSPIDLFDLQLADSTTFLFDFLDSDGISIPNAIVHTFRKYIGEGQFHEVERSKQDSNGETHIHLVEEDVIYYFVISEDGVVVYNSTNYNAKCLSTPCSIELSASVIGVPIPDNYDLVENGSYYVTSNRTTRKVNLIYSLDSPANMNLTVFKYSNNKNNITFVDDALAYSSSGNLEVSVPTSMGNYTYFAVVYKDGKFIYSKFVDMNTKPSDYYGVTGLIMGSLIVLTFGLMAISEGVLLLPLFVFGLIVAIALGLVVIGWYSLILIICLFGLLAWKLSQKRRTF